MEKLLQMMKSLFLKSCNVCGKTDDDDENPLLSAGFGVIAHKSCWLEEELREERKKHKEAIEYVQIGKDIYEMENARLRLENKEMLQFIAVFIKLAGGKVKMNIADLIEADGNSFEVTQDVKNRSIILTIREKENMN